MQKFKTEYWTFLPYNQEIIFKNGDEILLPSRLSRCLEALISRNGETVDYDNLLQEVWQTEHRESSTISSVISELRKVIGCQKDKVTFIKTVPKKGYRFVMPFEVEDVPSKKVVTHNALPDEKNQQSTQSIKYHSAEVSIPETDAKQQQNPEPSSSSEAIAPPVLSDSEVSSATTVYGYDHTDNNLLNHGHRKKTYALVAAISGVVILTLAVGVNYLPDRLIGGGMLYTDNEVQNQPKLSTEDTVNVLSESTVLTFEKGNELEFDVADDSTWILYTHKKANEKNKVIKAKNLITGEFFSLSTDISWDYSSPRISPQGDTAVYIRNSKDACEVRLVSFASEGFDEQSDRKLTSCGLAGGWTTPDFSHDGSIVYFSRSESLTDPYKIYRYDLEIDHELLVTSAQVSGRGDYSFTVSPDGKKLAVVRNQLWSETAILIYHLYDSSIEVLRKVPHLIYGVSWLSNDEVVYKDTNTSLVRHNILTDDLSILSNQAEFINYPVAISNKVYAFRGSRMNSSIGKIDFSTQPIFQSYIESAFSDHMPTFADNGLYFLSDRSGYMQLWHHSDSKHYSVVKFNEGIEVTRLLYSENNHKLYVVYDNFISELGKNGELAPIKEFPSNILNVSLSSDHTKIIYSIKDSSRWYIESMDIGSMSVNRIQRGFSGKLIKNQLFFSRFHQDGFFRYDLNTEKLHTIDDKFKVIDSGLWDLFDNNIVFVDGKKLIVKNHFGKQISEHNIDLNVRNIQCSSQKQYCLLDNYMLGETEIVELR